TGARKIFTDYLDDVSDKYAPRDQILAQMGPVAYQLADRSGYTLAGGSGFEANDLRGNKNNADWYFHTNVNLTYIFGSKDKCPRFNFRN
ncbi:MAG: hypothetical protein NZ108_06260, partial [Bacteroidia bacterium]|nr:hypothetical protein [Bacteroidia bacterium]